MKQALAIFMLTLGTAYAQTVPAVVARPSPPASAASQAIPMRSTAVKAAENATEPGDLRPAQRVIPQISIPLKRSNSPSPAAPPASLPAGSKPGIVNDGTARCMASSNDKARAACERGAAASGPLTMGK